MRAIYSVKYVVYFMILRPCGEIARRAAERIKAWRTIGFFSRKDGLWSFFRAKSELWGFFALKFIIKFL